VVVAKQLLMIVPSSAEAFTSEPVPTKNGSATEANPPQTEPSPTSADPLDIAGAWNGTAQWLCDNKIWETKLEFSSNGIVSASLTSNTDYASGDGTWVVNGNEISLQFQYGLWIGTISGSTISGTFTDNDCSGVWVVTKE
jgi:hypothetical protein